MNSDRRAGLISPGVAYAASGVLLAAGLLQLALWSAPLWGGLLMVAGLVVQWRAEVARREAIENAWRQRRPW